MEMNLLIGPNSTKLLCTHKTLKILIATSPPPLNPFPKKLNLEKWEEAYNQEFKNH